MTSIDVLQRWAPRYARIAIAAAFLSAVAGRFGLWTGQLRWEAFERFLAGVGVRWAAFGSAALLAWFGTAMLVYTGPKAPLDYSVYSASACALLLALHEHRAATSRGRPHESGVVANEDLDANHPRNGVGFGEPSRTRP